MTSLFGLSLSNLVLLHPWALLGLFSLPVVWFILKVMPPSPKRIAFPATRFIKDLVAEDIKSQDTPLWLRILRLSILALLILAFAHPVSKPKDEISWRGALRIVLDNSWAAAPTWNDQISTAKELLALAEREKSQVFILYTASTASVERPQQVGPISAIKARQYIKAAKPLPWSADYKALRDVIRKTKREGQSRSSITSFWLSHGIAEGHLATPSTELDKHGDVIFYKPSGKTFIPYIKDYSYVYEKNAFSVDIGVAGQFIPGSTVTLQAIGQNGTVLDVQTSTIGETEKQRKVNIDLPPTLRNQITEIRLKDQNHAASRYLLDDSNRKRRIGLVTLIAEDNTTPLVEAEYYISKALAPYADILRGEISSVLEDKPNTLILPDTGTLPLDDLNSLSQWVDAGGILIRFAGPNMARAAAEGNDTLTPVPLSSADRALDGALTWSTPLPIAPFGETSPFYGIDIPDKLTVKRQILAASSDGLNDKTWATLEDGTPLVTAKAKGEGLLILVHTTATPEWSDLALSGTFVKMLQKMISLSARRNLDPAQNQKLFPQVLISAFGQKETPTGLEKPIHAKDMRTTQPSALNPPGLYGNGASQTSLHLGHHLSKHTKRYFNVPSSANKKTYNNTISDDYKPYLLSLAVILFFIDWLVLIAIQLMSGSKLMRRTSVTALKTLAIVTLSGLMFTPTPSHAQNMDNNLPEEHMLYASNVSIGFVSTGSPQLDTLVRRGLEVLETAVEQRTSVSIGAIKSIDLDKDDLAFYTLIYWPITPNARVLSDDAQRNVQYFLDHGGTILFDTRDQSTAVNSGAMANTGRNTQYLRKVTAKLDIPPLHKIPNGHVLSKSFYLLKGYPGRYKNGSIWIEKQSDIGRDGVSSVLIGANDWAGAWAEADDTGFRAYGKDRQNEMALRFGINLVMYALTGNYKDDQVHIPHILQRLGQ